MTFYAPAITGKERDSESNLDNFGARYFISSMGRLLWNSRLTLSGMTWAELVLRLAINAALWWSVWMARRCVLLAVAAVNAERQKEPCLRHGEAP